MYTCGGPVGVLFNLLNHFQIRLQTLRRRTGVTATSACRAVEMGGQKKFVPTSKR